MKSWIRRIITLSALMAVSAVGAAAQPEPLPAAADQQRVILAYPVPQLIAPAEGATVEYAHAFVWTNPATPLKYTIKFTVAETGVKFKFNVPLEECAPGGNCQITAGATTLFDYAKDGDIVTWQVIAKHEAMKVKSTQRTAYVNSVTTPSALLPVNGAEVGPSAVLSWNHSYLNDSYVVVVKNAATGVKAAKYAMPADDCAASCIVSAQTIGGLSFETEYEWFVKAKGYNGDKAKSDKRTFTMYMTEVVMR